MTTAIPNPLAHDPATTHLARRNTACISEVAAFSCHQNSRTQNLKETIRIWELENDILRLSQTILGSPIAAIEKQSHEIVITKARKRNLHEE
jgi:hypothetical protein